MYKQTWGSITQLIFMASWFPVGCWLAEEADEVTLVDACMPFNAGGIVSAVRATGKPLTRIVLTHAHEDHVGAVAALRAAFPGVKVGISAREAQIMRGDRSLAPDESQTPIPGKLAKRAAFAPDFTFADGDRIGSLTAIAAPGHTPGHAAFLDGSGETLLAGDAFQTKGRPAVSGDRVATFPFPSMSNWHLPTSIASARKLAAFAPARLTVGHGYALERPLDAMRRAIDAAERRAAGRNSR